VPSAAACTNHTGAALPSDDDAQSSSAGDEEIPFRAKEEHADEEEENEEGEDGDEPDEYAQCKPFLENEWLTRRQICRRKNPVPCLQRRCGSLIARMMARLRTEC
jgi:hypothetical protein